MVPEPWHGQAGSVWEPCNQGQLWSSGTPASSPCAAALCCVALGRVPPLSEPHLSQLPKIEDADRSPAGQKPCGNRGARYPFPGFGICLLFPIPAISINFHLLKKAMSLLQTEDRYFVLQTEVNFANKYKEHENSIIIV